MNALNLLSSVLTVEVQFTAISCIMHIRKCAYSSPTIGAKDLLQAHQSSGISLKTELTISGAAQRISSVYITGYFGYFLIRSRILNVWPQTGALADS